MKIPNILNTNEIMSFIYGVSSADNIAQQFLINFTIHGNETNSFLKIIYLSKDTDSLQNIAGKNFFISVFPNLIDNMIPS